MTLSSQRTSSRIRKYIRNGWTVVKIPYNKETSKYSYVHGEENLSEYRNMIDWCETNLATGTWLSSLYSYVGNSEPGTKRFVFEREQDATLFILRWL